MPTAPGTSRDVDQDQEKLNEPLSLIEKTMQQYAPDAVSQYRMAKELPDGASDDDYFLAARTISRVVSLGKIDSVDGQVWNRGVPFKTGREYHAAMLEYDSNPKEYALDLKEWNETEDMEKRFEIAKKKLGKFHGFRTGVENVVQQLNNPALTDDELRGAPEEIIQANERLRQTLGKYDERQRLYSNRDIAGAGEIGILTNEGETKQALETVKQYREQRNKASIMAQYEGQLLSRNAWYHYLAARENWSPAADKIAQDVMKHGTMHPAQMDRFQTLPLPEQRELANFIHSAKRAGTANLLADMWQSFKDMLVDVPLDAARHATVDTVRRMVMDDDEYQKFAEERAILNQLEAPKMAEYGYIGQSAIGFASTIPYMGYAAIPKVGISIVAAKAAADFEDRVAAEGGDVTSAKFIGAKWGMAYAYAAVEKMQAMRLGKPLSSLEYRQALLQFWRLANAAIVAKIVAGNTVHETWEEGVQAGIEEGFVAWGLEKDIAKSAAGGLVQELKDTAGTMFLTSLAGAGGASVKARASKTHNINELITSQWHLMGLHDSMKNKDEKERKRHMQALGGIFRQWYEAGSHENAVEQFMARGMDRQTANELSSFIGMQHDAIMHDPDIQQSEKNAAFGLRRTTPDVVRDIHPDATIVDNGDGTFSISQNWNGKRVQFTVNQDWKPLQDINAANFAASVTEALQAVGEDMSVDKWTAMPEAEKLAMIEKYNIQVEGQFQVVAGDTSVTEGQAAALSGQIDLQENAHPATVLHELAHGFYAFARRSGMFSEQDVQKLREEFGDPRPGVDEQFNEEAAADAWRDFAAGKTRFTQSGILERAFDWIQDTVSGIAKARRRAEKEQTTRDSLLMQMYRGEFTGIPVGTITEAQRQKNAQMRKKSRAKPKKQAKKPQEPTAKEPEQAQEPSGAEIQPKGQAAEKPPSGEAVAGQGEDAESAAASADLDELKAPDAQPEATRQKLPGEHVAFTPGGEYQITAELVVVRRSDLIPSSDKRYPQRLQPRDVNAVGRRAQVHKIARNPQLSRIVEGSNTSDGYIYIDQNGNILSGNGRYAGISEAISIGTLTQAQLDAFMRNQAVKEGVVVPDGFSDILVVAMIRDLPDGLTLERFAELSNRNAILQRSEAETAEADAKTIIEKDLLKLFQPGADGNVLASSNQGFISALVQATGDASLVDSNNRPTEATRNRIRRALLAMLVGEGDNARDIVRGLVEDAKDLGMKTEVDGIVRASPDIVTVARDRPQYALLDEIGMALRMYMDMKREGSSPFQSDLFGRPEAVDLIVKALWSRSSAGAIADIFSDYATRARLVDTSTGSLGLDKDPTKEELLKAAIAATGTGETAEQAQQKKAEEAAAESPEAPPPPTQEQRAIEKKGAAPTATGQELRDAIAAKATPEPAKYDPEPNAPPTTGDMKEALPNMDELRFWRETPTLPMSRNPDVLGAAKILPYMLAGNKSHIYAHHHDMFEAVVQGAPAFVDCFGGAATYLYNLANAGVLPDNSTWNEWEYTRHVTTKQIKENPEGVIAALDALSDRLEQAIPPGSRVGAEIDSTRDAIIDWLNAELRGEHGIAYVPAENAEDAEGRTILLDTPESAALYLLVQNISYSARAQDVSMYEGKPTWTTAGDDDKLHPTDGKLLTLVDAKGKWGVSFRLAYPADIIRKASKLMVEKNVNVTQRDGWSLASDLDVAPDGAVVAIDTSYFGAQNYGLKTREDGDMDTWLAKVRKHLLPHVDRLTFIITNNWNFHAVNELQKMGFLVARTERAGESPELVAMSGRARHIIAPAIRTVDYLGQKVEQAGGDQARLSVSINPWTPEEGGRLYHGTAARDFGQFDGDIVYLAADPSETEPFAGMAEGSNRNVSTSRRPRVIAVNAAPGKIKNIDEAVADALMDDLDVEKHILAEANTARDEGFRYVSFSHPGIRSEREFDAIVSLYPKQDLKIDKERDIDGIQRDEQGDIARFSVSAKGLKALTTGVYKERSAEVMADLDRLPASLKPYVAKYDDADELINLSGFAGWKPGPKVAPPHIWPYRPAVRLADGRIAWHPRARMHSEALSMWLKQQDIPLDAFDIDDYYGDGGLGPDGRYYEKAYIGDGVSDFVEGRETGRFSVQARQPAPAFYSQLRRVIEQKVPNRATVAQIRATIDPAKGSGVKADEVFWSGLQEFLDGKKPTDMVTKEEVLAATREVVVRDVVKGEPIPPEIIAEYNAKRDAIERLRDMGGQISAREADRRIDELDAEYGLSEYDAERGSGRITPTKFANYVLPGGENYREILLTLPEATVPPSTYTVKKAKNNDGWAVFDQDDRQISGGGLSRQDATRLAEQWAKDRRPLPDPNKPSFRSGHFSEPNIVAHVRFNERTSADGKRTLFIEEIQSDWAQKGREEGFGGEWRVEDIDAHPNDRNIATFKSQEAAEAAAENYREADDSGHRIVVIEESAGVPSAPYVTKTDAWVSLALKRMVRLAAENGFEQVAWTTGIQQVSRYEESMRKVVDRIEWTKPFPSGNRGVVAIKNGAEVLNADVDKDGKVTAASHGDAIGKQLGEVVGKTLAERIMSETRNGSAEGKDLTIGGEGMKGFYDQIVPTTANKLFKRFGAKVGEAWFDLGDPENAVAPPPDDMVDEGGFTAHALPITPALRDSVLYEGQARFSVKANNIRSIQKFYHAFSRGMTPDVADAFDAAYTLRNYFDEYLEWYKGYWDKRPHDQAEIEENNRVKAAYEQRLSELDAAIQSSDLQKLIAAVDNGVNQWHLDYPVIAHLQMEYEQQADDPDAFESVFSDIVAMLRGLGRLPEQSPYRDATPPRYSVKAYPNLYRDVLSKNPASAKLDGNKAWLTLDGKWINVDEHRDAVPFDDGIYADIGVQEMAEAGLVRVHWVDFSSMPGGVMYAEHAPGQLTRAQRKELEDTAIERGGEVEYDPGQAWIRQPPPRYSFTAHAPKWSGNTTAIASLAVQHLMGQELNTEMAERSMRLFRVEDATADQLIAHAKKYAEGEVGKAAAKYLAGKDPTHAITAIAQQAELDAIAAAKEGIQTGLKMGRKAMKAEMDAEKRLIRDARGENLQTLIVDTGVDMGETMFQTLPELFSEWEKPKDEGPQPPEGPRQVQPEVEPPPADPAVLAERDRRMRNLIDAARAWGDQERAKREKLAEERRKAQQEAAEKGEKAEDTAEDEEGMEEADEVAIPKELLQAHGVDLRNSKELARFLRLWIADWIVRTSKGRLTHQTVWKDRVAVEQYRKTMMEQMTEMGHKLVEPEGYALVHITTMIQEIPSTAKPDTIERRASAILSVIQANAIRQTRAQLVAEIRKDIDREMVQHKHFKPMEQDIKRKVTGEHELTARYLKKILSWSPQKIDREVAEIQQKLADRTQIYQEDGKDGQPLNVSLDAEYHRNLMKLGVLQLWGGIKRKLPAEIKRAGIEIRGWTAKAQERLYARWLKHEQAVAALVDAMNDGIVPDNPDQARKVWGAIEDWSQSNLVHLRHRLEGLIRQQHDPVKRQKAMDAIDEIMYQITRGTEVYSVLHHKYVTQFQDAVREVSGGTVASAIEYMKHLEEEIDPDIAKQISRQGFTGEDGGQVMTYNQAMQLYASLTQRHYAGNVKLHKREEHAALIESIMTTADLKLINRLRQIYEARRKELSEAVQQITGLPVWRPDPLYMPVRVLMGPKGGLGVIGNPQSWQPLAKSLTPRQHHGRDFDETATLTGTFYDSAEDAARAIGYGVRGLTVRGVLGNRVIQENIERYYGGDRLREMLKQTTHALDGVPKTGRDANDKLVNRIRELNAYAALSWNLLTALKQIISFPMFAAVLPDGFVGVAKAIANFDKEALRELMESDWYKARYKGGINPEVAEILADSRSGYIAKFYKAGMSLVQIGDFVPSAIVATGIYRAKRDAFIDQGMDPEQAKQRASTLTGELIELTQQSSRPENMPNVYREGTGWGKLFLQFASANLSQFSHEFHAAQDFRAGVEGSGARLVRTVMLNHVIIPGLLRMVTSLFHFLIGRPPKEDEPLFLMLLDHAIGGAMSRLLIVGAIAETVYDAAVEGKISFGAGRMVPAEALNRTIAYGIRSARDLLWEQDMEAFQSDLWKMLEGMSAPLRYGGELYRNRIAQ